MPTSKGALHACKFVQTTEVVAASTEAGKKINFNIAHWPLGNRNEDSAQKAVTELGCVLTHGTICVCKYCAKSEAEQIYVKKVSVDEKAMVPRQRLYLNFSKLIV